jgi:LDH2 family malate/lactate/ureidoglycolate dehydrogenase
MDAPRFAAPALGRFAEACFRAVGMPEADARLVADNLLQAELRGIDSHGLTRIPIYTERIRRGVVNPRPDLRFERRQGAIAALDGDNGSGAVVGWHANREAVRLAKAHGVGCVVARRSNHYGICSWYTMAAAAQGCIGVSATNASPSMAVWGGREPAIGTNPLSLAVPAERHPPIVLDMASSVVARGKVVEKAKRGEPIPEGWALDRDGRPTTDARAAEAGVILPLGPKGSGLAVLVDVLCGVLAGAAYGALLNNMYRNFTDPQDIGHFFLALDIRAFQDPAAFAARIDDMIDRLKAGAPAEGHAAVLMPGEIEARLEQRLRREGIALPPNVLDDLRRTGAALGVGFPPAG